jgi:predicted HicB family RNase H-like nuclease
LGKKSKFLVSVPFELHLWLKEISELKGISVNAYVNLVLSDKKRAGGKEKGF